MNTRRFSQFSCKPVKAIRHVQHERSFFHIILTEAIDQGKAAIYFIQPFQELPYELIRMKAYHLMFQFEFLHLNTEHKEILFQQPFILSEFQFYKINLNKEQTTFLETIFRLIQRETRKPDVNAAKCIISFINIIFNYCARLLKPGSYHKQKQHYTSLLIVSRFRELIYRNAKKQRTVSFYANQLTLTPNYLNIVLKSVTGKNASTHIFDFLLNEAKYLLIHTKLSLKEVAVELGFNDQSYFTRFFRKQTGRNPLDWFNKTI